MGDRVWKIPQDAFVEAWNGSESATEATERCKQLAGGNVPRWAVMARAVALKKTGIEMRSLPSNPVAVS